MSSLKVRKRLLVVEDIFHEGGPVAERPLQRGAAIAVIANPFAGRYEPDIQWFMDDLRPLGLDMARQLVAALGGAERIEGYGKGSLVGAAG
ncbi:MAG: amino acid synthesis family protein, partial [Rhodobacteraceae bacterium]|nr:amino acid synthesis family protein [Paracoccaceae bacterium]